MVKTAESDRALMLFDLALGGHHGSYIQHLLEFWYDHNLLGDIDLVVMPEFLTIHRDVVHLVEQRADPRVQIIPISQSEANALAPRSPGFKRLYRNLQEWQLFRKYAAQRQATQALVLYLDTCEIPLTLGLPSPCPFSGIYFRPTFHYSSFTGDAPSREAEFQQKRERFTLARIVSHPQFSTLFCLDPFAVRWIESMSSTAQVVHLPDPVRLDSLTEITSSQIRDRLHIEPQRQVFLLFGALDGRKGIDQLLAAIALLPADLNERLCLVLAGGTNSQEQARIRAQVTAIRQNHLVQIVEDYHFIAEAEVPAYFHLADVVLAPYQRHVGMSGILLWAAAAGKPVLSSDYGLMGEMVRRYGLGLTVDSTAPEELAKGLTQCLLEVPEQIGDRHLMRSFAEQNSSEQFASTIFQYLFEKTENNQLINY